MSSTRTAKDDSILTQSRYASSPEFERGLVANMVAKRAALLGDKADRELVWALHFLSWEPGGLAAVARELLARYSDRIGTPTMVNCKKAPAQNFSTEEVRQIRLELPANLRHKFPLKGELESEIRELRTKYDQFATSAERAIALREAAEIHFLESACFDDIITGERERRENHDREQASKHPASYPVLMLRDLCFNAAEVGIAADRDYPATPNLERTLAEMCLDPQWNFERGGPWYFTRLIDVLRDYVAAWTAAKTNWPETKLGQIVSEEFDYTAHARCLSLLEGDARRGKSFAAKNCCLKNIGRARYIEVPVGSNEKLFFTALARGLGIGNFLNYKAGEIRERVEAVLLSGDLILVLDEAQRLWPERYQRFAQPSRINWVMMLANQKVPILLISTPQFMTAQKVAEKTGWNSAQLTGRMYNYKQLPAELDDADLIAICQAVLPEASQSVFRVLATYARTSARYLAAIESIAQRARYLAARAGRQQCTTEDVRTAMKESVIPSDTRLNSAIETTRAQSSRRRLPAVPLAGPAELMETSPSPARHRLPEPVQDAPAPRRANLAEFATA